MWIWILKVLVIVLAIGVVGFWISCLVASVKKHCMEESLKLYKKILIPEIEGMADRMTRNMADALIDSIKKFEKMEDEHVDFN